MHRQLGLEQLYYFHDAKSNKHHFLYSAQMKQLNACKFFLLHLRKFLLQADLYQLIFNVLIRNIQFEHFLIIWDHDYDFHYLIL